MVKNKEDFQSSKYMNTQTTYQPLNHTSLSLAGRAGRLLGKWMEMSEVNEPIGAVADGFSAEPMESISAPLTASTTAADFCDQDQDGGWELAFHRTIMMDIRGANP